MLHFKSNFTINFRRTLLKKMRYIKLFSILFLLMLATPIGAALSIAESSADRTHAPQGQSSVVMIYFTLETTDDDISINGINIENQSDDVDFGKGISNAYLYLDTGFDGIKDSDDILLDSLPFSASSIQSGQFEFTSQTITSANATAFIILYDFGATATLGGETNLTLTEIKGTSSTNDLSLSAHTDTTIPISNSVIVTGIKKITIVDVAPSVVLPGQTNIPMLYVSISLSDESILSESPMTFSLKNESNNYATADSATDGVVEARLLLANFYPFDTLFESDNTIHTISIDDSDEYYFPSASNFDFSFGTDGLSYPTDFQGISTGTTKNFYIVYDVGEDISVTEDTTISAQLYSFIGYGENSGLTIEWPLSSQTREASAESLVAGLSLEDIESIVPDGDSFGSGTTVPMLSFTLRSNHTDITVNAITLFNEGTVPFRINTDDEDVINVSVYRDSDGDKSYSDADTQVADVDLGMINDITGITNQSDVVVVPFLNTSEEQGIIISSYDSEALGYPSNNDEVFFVTYTFGKTINGGVNASGNTTFVSDSSLGELFATASITIDGEVTSTALGLSGVNNTNGAYASPEAEVTLVESNLSIINILDISPDSVYLGQLQVPMLSLELDATKVAFTSTNIRILNSGGSFLDDNTGVSKVWIYRDNPPYGEFDSSSDEFINSTDSFLETTSIDIFGIDLNSGINRLLLLYNIGQNDEGRDEDLTDEDQISIQLIKAQINDIETDSDAATSVVLVGQLPLPVDSANVAVYRAFFDTIDISISNPDDAATTTLNVSLEFTNDSSSILSIESIHPRIYLDSLGGSDISYEFNIEPADSSEIEYPYDIAAGNSETFEFEIRHRSQESEGIGYLDASIKYTVDGQMTPATASILLSRYRNNTSYASAVKNPPELSLVAAYDDYSWVFPSYIASVEYKRTATDTFSQGMALKAGDSLIITFKDKGSYINQSSLYLSLNGNTLTRTSINENSSGTYYYDETTGILTIEQLGAVDGTIELDVNDGVSSLTQATFSYEINSSVELSNVLFYPNPYKMGESALILGYFTTQPCNVTMYLFDHNGIQVFTDTQEATTIGSNKFELGANTSALAPGIYLCKVIAEDNNGNEYYKVTKLSIF